MTDTESLPEKRYFPQLEGMRAIAALGVLTTHVAFQTRAVQWPVLGPVLGRLDLAVALFFALSGFLLWRPYADAARHPGLAAPDPARYLRHRFVRIWPAYTVAVIAVLALLPQASGSSITVWVANLTLTQVFFPLTLAPGLTQMWSLSVEVAFYLLLPVIGYGLLRLRGDRARARIPLLLGLGLASLGWAWLVAVLPLAEGVEGKNWVFGHLPWFLAGLILAELAAIVALTGPSPLVQRVTRWSSNKPLMLAVAGIFYGLACTPLAGPVGLADLSNGQYVGKMVFGAIAAYAVLAPLVFGDPASFRFLNSGAMTAMGRWSYAIFIWHLAVLTCVFGLFGIPAFNGHFATVWILTVVLTLGISAASYAFVEDPCRRALAAWEQRRTPTPTEPVPLPDTPSGDGSGDGTGYGKATQTPPLP